MYGEVGEPVEDVRSVCACTINDTIQRLALACKVVKAIVQVASARRATAKANMPEVSLRASSLESAGGRIPPSTS